MSLFGHWSQADEDYRDEMRQAAEAAKAELNARVAAARDSYERSPSRAARDAMDDAHRQLRGLGDKL